MKRFSFQKRARVFLTLMAGVFIFVRFVASAMAADLSDKEIQVALKDSLKAILTGEEFSADLQERQKILTDMMETGAVSKGKLVGLMKETILPVLKQHKTSRYILKKAPERANKLFAPYMDWKELKKIVWERGSSVIPEGQQMQIKIGTLAPPGTPWLMIPEKKLIPRIKKLSHGKVAIKIYGGGVMGQDTDILRKMDIGQLDGCGCTALGILAASPEMSVFLLPGLFESYEEVDYIFKKFRKRIDKSFAQRGYILAALIDTGNFYIFSKNRISGLDDLKNQKFYTWFGEIETTLFEELGVDAIPVAVPEVVSALSAGMANSGVGPSAWFLGMQAYQYVNYYVKQPLLYSPAAIVISQNAKEGWKKQFGLSETFTHNIQEMLVYEVSSLEDEWRTLVRKYERRSLKAFEEKCGMVPITFSDKDQKALAAAGRRVRQQLAGEAFPADFMKDIIKALEAYRASAAN